MRKTHLVGSVPLHDAAEVMLTVMRDLGPFLDRIPDGETGARLNWLGWQRETIAACPGLAASDTELQYGSKGRFVLAPGAGPEDVSFAPFGYANAAIESFAVFAGLQKDGLLPPTMRFQVNLPTPLAITAGYIEPASQEAVEPRIAETLLSELATITAAIDNAKLAIQWDVAIEFAILHAGWPVWFSDRREQIVDRLGRLARSVPPAAELGYHLCFGDSGHKHFVEPESLAPLVAIANEVSAAAGRTVQWFHMPVPRNRADADYFAPLAGYAAQAELYLGLIHLTDGFDGTAGRLAAAGQFGVAFGVATECGFGRRPPETVAPLLELHRQVCERL